MYVHMVFATLLSRKAGQLLTANLIERKYGVTPIAYDVGDDGQEEFSEVYEEGPYSVLVSLEVTCKEDNSNDLHHVIVEELKKLQASYHSVIVVEKVSDITWEGPNILLEASSLPLPSRFEDLA